MFNPIDFFLHFDKHLTDIVQNYGPWVYALLFGIIFAETGLVVTPFLPGDSLLFAVGALAGSTGVPNGWLSFVLLCGYSAAHFVSTGTHRALLEICAAHSHRHSSGSCTTPS